MGLFCIRRTVSLHILFPVQSRSRTANFSGLTVRPILFAASPATSNISWRCGGLSAASALIFRPRHTYWGRLSFPTLITTVLPVLISSTIFMTPADTPTRPSGFVMCSWGTKPNASARSSQAISVLFLARLAWSRVDCMRKLCS